MSPANISPAREASPRHRKRGFIRSSRRTRGFLTEHQDEIVANVDGDIQNASSSLGASDEAVIIQKLEQKRMQLDAQIAQYISEKQREYDTSERELYQSTEEKDDSSEKNETPSKETVGKLDSRGRTTKKSRNLSLPSSRAIWAPATTSQDSSEEGEPAQGSRTPTHEREKEFHGLFTPFFLPLLDAGSRSNSAPPVPSATADGSPDPTQGYQSDSAGRQQVRRAVTEPFVKPALSKKSALRSPKKSPDRKKRVSLIIDDEIVRPSESPKDTHLPPTPTDEEAPNVAMTDRDGTPIHVWVPEKARLPYPDEDALDYVIAVGGTLYQGADVPDSYPAAGKVLANVSQAPKDDSEGAPLQRFPSDSLHSIDSTAHTFAWSPPQNENVFGMSPNWDGSALPNPSAPIEEPKHSPASPDPPVISPPEAAYTLPQEQAPSPTPKKAAPANSPPRSPRSPLSASFSRHAPSYIDKFSTTSNRVFGNMADDAAAAAEEAGLAYLDDGGPSSSYVGGLGGSGIDAVDIGSAGYPSSLGASYMEQFAAARAMDQRAKLREEQEKERRADEASELERAASHDDRPEDEAFLGEMDDF